MCCLFIWVNQSVYPNPASGFFRGPDPEIPVVLLLLLARRSLGPVTGVEGRSIC